jgi:hypothetical protein
MQYAGDRRDVQTTFWYENPNERNPKEDSGVYGRITLKWILKKWGGRVSTGLIWLRIGTSSGLL